MKIYYKKNWVEGIVLCVLALALLICCCMKGFRFKSVILMILCLCFGISAIARSLSKQCAKEDRLEEQDERNQLIALKSKEKAFNFMQNMILFLDIVSISYGAYREKMVLIGFGVMLSFLWTISIILESLFSWYYEKHM